MLSRTADSLYWLARYIERAENVARAVLVGHRMSSVALSLGSGGNEWISTLIATGCEAGYFSKYAEANSVSVLDYLVRDSENPSSILACLETARRNGKKIATACGAADYAHWIRMGVDLLFCTNDIVCLKMGARAALTSATEAMQRVEEERRTTLAAPRRDTAQVVREWCALGLGTLVGVEL